MAQLLLAICLVLLSFPATAARSALQEIVHLRGLRAAAIADTRQALVYSNRINNIISGAKRPAPIASANAYKRTHYGFRDARAGESLSSVRDAIAEAYIFNNDYNFDFMAGYADQSMHTSDVSEAAKNRQHLQFADFINRFTKQALYGVYRDRLHEYAREAGADADRGFTEVLQAMSVGTANSLKPTLELAKQILHKDYFKRLEDLMFHYKPVERANYYAKKLDELNIARLRKPTADGRRPFEVEIRKTLIEADVSEPSPSFNRAAFETITASLILTPDALTRGDLKASAQLIFDQAARIVRTRKINDSAWATNLYRRDAKLRERAEHLINAAHVLKEGRYNIAEMCPRRSLPCLLDTTEYFKAAEEEEVWGGSEPDSADEDGDDKARRIKAALAINHALGLGFPYAWERKVVTGKSTTGEGVTAAVVDTYPKDAITKNAATLFGKAEFQEGFDHKFDEDSYHGTHVASIISSWVDETAIDMGFASGSTVRLFAYSASPDVRDPRDFTRAHKAIIGDPTIDVLNKSSAIAPNQYDTLMEMMRAGVIPIIAAGNNNKNLGKEMATDGLAQFLASFPIFAPDLKDMFVVITVYDSKPRTKELLYRKTIYANYPGHLPANPEAERFMREVIVASSGDGTFAKDPKTGELREMDGTSAATPHTTAAVMLLIQHYNDLWFETFRAVSATVLFEKIKLMKEYKVFRGQTVVRALRQGAIKIDPISKRALDPAIFGSGVVSIENSMKLLDVMFSQLKNIDQMRALHDTLRNKVGREMLGGVF